jgi:uridine kinase
MNSLVKTLLVCRKKDHDNAHLYNFDHPDALDFDLAFEKINELVKGHDCQIPTYDFATH